MIFLRLLTNAVCAIPIEIRFGVTKTRYYELMDSRWR